MRQVSSWRYDICNVQMSTKFRQTIIKITDVKYPVTITMPAGSELPHHWDE
jgi:hypothetical protein